VIRFGWAQNVATPSTVSARVNANLFSIGARHCLDPYQIPPVALPNAYVPRMKPASGLCPKLWANATVLRSIDTNIAPSSRYTGASTTSPGAAAPRARPSFPARPGFPAWSADRSGGTTNGSVPRSAANHSVPSRHSRAATPTPEAGKISVASSVTAAGPTMKHSSSATDSKENAVCNRGEPASSTLQRARTIVPSDGMVAPATAPGTKKAQVGSWSCTVTMSSAVATPNTVSRGSNTRRWPCESTARATRGEVTA
jgi:hypothetical protein